MRAIESRLSHCLSLEAAVVRAALQAQITQVIQQSAEEGGV